MTIDTLLPSWLCTWLTLIGQTLVCLFLGIPHLLYHVPILTPKLEREAGNLRAPAQAVFSFPRKLFWTQHGVGHSKRCSLCFLDLVCSFFQIEFEVCYDGKVVEQRSLFWSRVLTWKLLLKAPRLQIQLKFKLPVLTGVYSFIHGARNSNDHKSTFTTQ